jgi:quercetin dioxygenase-like cupin family protein
MKIFQESDMIKGWFVGDFDPVVFKSSQCEVGVKRYKTGDYEPAHVHKIATEITMVIEGRAQMGPTELTKGSIVMLEPGEGTDFRALEDTLTVTVKVPSVPGDKYDFHSA